MLCERQIALAKTIHQNPLDFKPGSRENLFITKDGSTYAVFTEEESLNEIERYMKEYEDDFVFSNEWLSTFTGKSIEEIQNHFDTLQDFVSNDKKFIELIESTCGWKAIIKACVESNGGYGYYINAGNDKDVKRIEDFYIFTFY